MWTQTLTQLSVWALEYVAALDSVLIVPQHKDRGMCACVSVFDTERVHAWQPISPWCDEERPEAKQWLRLKHKMLQNKEICCHFTVISVWLQNQKSNQTPPEPCEGKNTVITNSVIFYSSDLVVKDRRFIRQWANDSIVSWCFHALATAAGSAWRRPSSDLSSGLHSGAVLLTGLQPFITVFHYCTKSR